MPAVWSSHPRVVQYANYLISFASQSDYLYHSFAIHTRKRSIETVDFLAAPLIAILCELS